ncbi:phosphoenolpyruvate synthase [Candidatus Microgenomates bacterium]|nr:phosphoenolpyruvate synthase [Candidatus Microgenomates bacterium]
MTVQRPFVAFFKDIDKHDIPMVGGKGANLGEMTKAGFPVPNGFAVTVESYDLFLQQNNLSGFINETIKSVDANDPKQLDSASKAIQKKIIQSKIPDIVAHEVHASYKKLSGTFKKALVAVRSSATAEDLPGMSFAGQQATFLNIKGDANLMNSIRECWASLFTPRAIFYRNENKIDTSKVKISVMVQKMVQSVVSGVMFTVNPVTQDKQSIVVDAVWGLGEMIVQGSVIPDHYVVQKDTFAILSKEISDQSIQLIRVGETTKETQVPEKIRDNQKISNEIIIKLAKIGQKLQDHYYYPQDIEWAYDEKEVYITQTRPITTLSTSKKSTSAIQTKESKDSELKIAQAPILTGVPASPGIGVGPVRQVKSPKEIDRVKPGDILVSKMTSPDFVPAMKKASAIITDEGGLTSHAAIVSRELGIPCVVGTKDATTKLKEDTVVSVDGLTGQVFLGGNVKKEVVKKVEEPEVKTKTATRIYVNLAEPEMAAKIAKQNVDGVGLLRAEFMIAQIGVHPKEAIKNKTQEKYIQKLTDGLEKFCSAFEGRPVVYRATDFKTNEYRSLEGGKYWEPEEPNPLMGFRGAFRYITNPEVFNLELQAIKRVRAKYNNLWLMIPFCRSPQELTKVRKLVASEGLFESTSFKFWMMAELPVNVIMLEKFIEVGIDGISIGSNDLTMLVLGTDRDNADVASAYDELSPAVLWSLRRLIRKCHKYGISSSICGQAPTEYEELVEKLVSWGVTSMSVNPDSINRVRSVVAKAERDLVNKQ